MAQCTDTAFARIATGKSINFLLLLLINSGFYIFFESVIIIDIFVFCDWQSGIYKGNLSNGEPEGDGVCLAPGGEKYIGQWRQGRKEGAGVFHFANG